MEEASEEFLDMASLMADICQSMYPEWRHIDLVVVACGDFGGCALIKIGAHGWKPPGDVIAGTAKEPQKYGLVEKPNQFLGVGLKSALHNSFCASHG